MTPEQHRADNEILATWSFWRDRLDVIQALVRERGMKHYQAAGLGNKYDSCILHNCIVAAHYGKPWKGVNVKEAKRAKYTFDVDMWKGSRILEAWYKRKMDELRTA